jgi:hypothetical protein
MYTSVDELSALSREIFHDSIPYVAVL